MTRTDLKRRIGGAAAFVAVYALVLNVVLSSLLAASVSPAAAAAEHVLCISGAERDAAQNDAGKSGQKSVIHCPLCIAHHVTGALPPPPSPVLVDRSQVELRMVMAFEERFVARFPSHDHLSRGPPGLA